MLSEKSLVERFRLYVAEHALFTNNDRLLLAVSGGVDSMVMLSLFARCGYSVAVAHCNFQLRGKESDDDEMLVETQVRKYGLDYYNRRFDTTGEMERTGDSMEMAARRLRYDWFHSLCDEHGYTTIAIAHHIDDSIETFFINLLRGTGLKGLTGIGNRMGRVVRPMMFATRKEILEYAVAEGIPYREDSSNRSTKYLRNKIRLGLIPMIREINPKFTDLMRSNIEHLTDARRFLAHAVEMMSSNILESLPDGSQVLYPMRIGDAPSRRYVIYELLSERYGFKGDTVSALCRAFEGGDTGKRFYSREYVAVVEREESIVVSAITADDDCTVTVNEGDLRCYCGNSMLIFERMDIGLVREFGVPSDTAQIDADKLKWPLTLRRWREGDRFIPFGMNGCKKVGDFLTDCKASTAEKQRQFVLLSGDDIVWLVGRRIDNRYRLTNDTDNVLKITCETI